MTLPRADPSVGRPSTVAAAAVLSGAYSLGPLWFGGAAWTVLLRTGGWGEAAAAKGMVLVGIAGLLGAALLVGGAVRIWRGSFAWTLVLLLMVLAFGSVGEVVDVIGTASATSDLIGAGILVAALVPVGLLCTPSARAFAAGRRHR